MLFRPGFYFAGLILLIRPGFHVAGYCVILARLSFYQAVLMRPRFYFPRADIAVNTGRLSPDDDWSSFVNAAPFLLLRVWFYLSEPFLFRMPYGLSQYLVRVSICIGLILLIPSAFFLQLNVWFYLSFFHLFSFLFLLFCVFFPFFFMVFSVTYNLCLFFLIIV